MQEQKQLCYKPCYRPFYHLGEAELCFSFIGTLKISTEHGAVVRSSNRSGKKMTNTVTFRNIKSEYRDSDAYLHPPNEDCTFSFCVGWSELALVLWRRETWTILLRRTHEVRNEVVEELISNPMNESCAEREAPRVGGGGNRGMESQKGSR